MKKLYSFFSLLLTITIMLIVFLTDILLIKNVIYEVLSLLNINGFNISIIIGSLAVVLLFSFVIILLLYRKKNTMYVISSFLASSLSIGFFTLFFSSFDIVKKFYFLSNEFSELVKSSFNKIVVINLVICFVLTIISVIYLLRRRKNEKEN